MSALHQLEQRLRQSVDTGQAADPSLPEPSPVPVRRPRWFGHRLLGAIVLSVGVATGAVAASGVFRVEPERPWSLAVVADPNQGPGVPTSPVRVLPLRVPDPQGGPPWVLRTFTTSRGAACLQAGQLYGERFGRVERDDRGQRIFRLVGVHLGETARCTNRVLNGLPVQNGMRTVAIDGGLASPGRCGPQPGRRGACRIRSVTVVRFGLLGPRAVAARWVDRGGFRTAEQRLSTEAGGAYLIAREANPEPWRAYEALNREIQDEADRRFPVTRRRAGLSPGERRDADRQFRRRLDYVAQQYARTRQQSRAIARQMQGSESIEATFANGQRLLVAGRGAKRDALPGVPRLAAALPVNLRRPISVQVTADRRPILVSFAAPIALQRMGEAFRVTVRGPKAPACRLHEISTETYVSRTTALGDRLRVSVPEPRDSSAPPARWCAGRRYDVRVRFVRAGSGGRATERAIGVRSIVVP